MRLSPMPSVSAWAWVFLALASLLVAAAWHLEPGRFEANTQLHALAKAAGYVKIDIAYLRWLWWPFILYLFWAMAHICDIYFIRAIEVISERFMIPDNVAGATLMALGCNGPELALNMIAIAHPSEVGVGAVIGGEVFNVLVILGTALLATPSRYMPLKLGRFTFFRDVLFYAVSVALLFFALRDGYVGRGEAALLLCGEVAYTVTVLCSEKLRRFFTLKFQARELPRDANSSSTVIPDPLSPRRLQLLEQWEQAVASLDPARGSVLEVRVDFRNRLMDVNHRFDSRFITLQDSGLFVSTLVDPGREGQHDSHCASGIVYDHADSNRDVSHWHHGGLINQPRVQDCSGLPCLKDSLWEAIPFEDIVYIEQMQDPTRFHLHVHIHDDSTRDAVTLEFGARQAGPQSTAVVEAWVQLLKTRMTAQRRRMAAPEPTCKTRCWEWIQWLKFPVKALAALTIPDMDRPALQNRYPLAFVMSMAWLAALAYCVVLACDGIHSEFQINKQLIGFTIAAVGTSFPNVFSGMVVARQGKTGMAVANALGANVQNVFLALGVPWTIQTFFISRGPFELRIEGLGNAVAQIYATLLPVLVVFVACGCSLPRWSGSLFLCVYACYFGISVGQELSHDATWPFS